jgi:diguanylate cyclase (GGDEF)-like protein
MSTPISNETFNEQSGYDSFTRIYSDLVESSIKNKATHAIALVDIDEFGKLNEQWGREIGDDFIEYLGRFLRQSQPENAQVFRYGGDAYMVMFPHTEKEQAFLAIETSRKEFQELDHVDLPNQSNAINATISCGVAAFSDDGQDASAVIRKCHEALYRAKVSGRNKVSLSREEKMVTKTTHYTQGQLEGLSRLAKREGMNEAALLREALDDLLRKHNS